MSTRNARRRKVVLPVTVVRDNGEQQTAHTLDITAISARLGGVYMRIQPGEEIELRRGPARARFQVVWVGAAHSAMTGQAGMRGLFTGNRIWGPDAPPDEPDVPLNTELLRSKYPLVRTAPSEAEERRWHTRFDCTGSASVLAADYRAPIYAEIKNISPGGVFVKTVTVFPANTRVHLKLDIGGIRVELPGVVRTSRSMVGMGIGFQRSSRTSEEKLALAVSSLKRRSVPRLGSAQDQKKASTLILPDSAIK